MIQAALKCCILAIVLWPAAYLPSADLLDGARFDVPSVTFREIHRTAAIEPHPALRLAEAEGKISIPTESDRAISRELLARRARRAGDGGGADVENLLLLQTDFVESACGPNARNVLLITWEETADNPLGVDVIVDGKLVINVPGLAQLPGINAVQLVQNIDAGEHIVRIEDGESGDFKERSILILDGQPFSDVTGLRCETGREGDGNTCGMIVDWSNEGQLPQDYILMLDGGVVAQFEAGFPGIRIFDVPDGDRCTTLTGVLQNDEGSYRGCVVESCCTLDCAPQDCPAPAGLSICQIGFGNQGVPNTVRLLWQNTDSIDYQQIVFLFDGRIIGALPGNFNQLFITDMPLATATIDMIADCGGATADVKQIEYTARGLTPHDSPITGDIVAELDEDSGETIISWELDEPSEYIFVWLNPDPGTPPYLSPPGAILGGRSTSLDATVLREGNNVYLQFFGYEDSQCFGSNIYSTAVVVPPPPPPPGETFIRGVCTGVGDRPQISSAVFGLNFLFLSGQQPPCLEACDTNGDGNFNLTDSVHLLLFLFQGGPPPAMWTDSDNDGVADPVCERIIDEEGCSLSNRTCGV